MIRINVGGIRGSGKSGIIKIILDALEAEGKTALVVADEVDVSKRGLNKTIDVVIEEVCVSGTDKYDFLIGRTESEAYELAQDNGFVVRIASRNGMPMVNTRDYVEGRINLYINNNIVTNVAFG